MHMYSNYKHTKLNKKRKISCFQCKSMKVSLTERVKEIGDLLYASCDDFNVFSVRPVLLNLFLNSFSRWSRHFC